MEHFQRSIPGIGGTVLVVREWARVVEEGVTNIWIDVRGEVDARFSHSPGDLRHVAHQALVLITIEGEYRAADLARRPLNPAASRRRVWPRESENRRQPGQTCSCRKSKSRSHRCDFQHLAARPDSQLRDAERTPPIEQIPASVSAQASRASIGWKLLCFLALPLVRNRSSSCPTSGEIPMPVRRSGAIAHSRSRRADSLRP